MCGIWWLASGRTVWYCWMWAWTGDAFSVTVLMKRCLSRLERAICWMLRETVAENRKVCNSGFLGRYSLMASISSRKPISRSVSVSSRTS